MNRDDRFYDSDVQDGKPPRCTEIELPSERVISDVLQSDCPVCKARREKERLRKQRYRAKLRGE